MINNLLGKFFGLLPGWLSILIALAVSLLAIILAALLGYILVRAVLRIRWESQTAKRFIRIDNQGNVTGKFLLRVDGPQEELKFQCLLDGKPLPDAPAAPKAVSPQHNLPAQPARNSNTVQLVVDPGAAHSDGDSKAKQKLTESSDKAKEKSKKVLGLGRLFSSIFGTLGSLLPGSLGESFKEKSADLQKTTQDASAKMQIPDQKLKSAEHLKGQVKQLNPNAQGEKAAPVQNPIEPPAGSTHSAAPASVDVSAGAPNLPVGIPAGFLKTTPVISPGESLYIELLMDPRHPYHTGEYSFAVGVHQQATPEGNQTESISRGRVMIWGLSPIYWVLSFLMILCAVLLNGTWAFLFVSWLIGFIF